MDIGIVCKLIDNIEQQKKQERDIAGYAMSIHSNDKEKKKQIKENLKFKLKVRQLNALKCFLCDHPSFMDDKKLSKLLNSCYIKFKYLRSCFQAIPNFALELTTYGELSIVYKMEKIEENLYKNHK